MISPRQQDVVPAWEPCRDFAFSTVLFSKYYQCLVHLSGGWSQEPGDFRGLQLQGADWRVGLGIERQEHGRTAVDPSAFRWDAHSSRCIRGLGSKTSHTVKNDSRELFKRPQIAP